MASVLGYKCGTKGRRQREIRLAMTHNRPSITRSKKFTYDRSMDCLKLTINPQDEAPSASPIGYARRVVDNLTPERHARDPKPIGRPPKQVSGMWSKPKSDRRDRFCTLRRKINTSAPNITECYLSIIKLLTHPASIKPFKRSLE